MIDARFVAEAMEERSARAKGYDFSKSIENIKKKRFHFGARNREANAVDIALANLFDCLSVECSGILVHPQWKHFSHIEIVKNDQLRLSNGIWRSWHMQFQKGRVPSFCFFDIEAQLDHHRGQKSVVLEGQYWKRRVEAVAREYRKWRIYHRDKNKLLKGREPWLEELLERAHGDELGNGPKPQAMQVEPARSSFMEEFPDALFLTTQQDSPGEPPVYTSTADVIPQPNLDMLNPTLEDLLEKFEPMEVMLSRSMGAAASFFTASNAYGPLPPPFRQDVPPFSQQFPTPMQTSEQFASPSLLLPTPPKPLTQTQPPFASQFSVGHATAQGLLADQHYALSPTTFLALPSEQPKTQEEAPVESCMDIGVPQNYAMKPESNVDGGSMSTCTHTQFNSSVPAFQSQHQPPSTPTPNPTPTLTPTITPTPTPSLSPTPQSQHYTGALNGSAMAMQDAIFSMAASSSTSVGATPQQKDLSISSLLGLFGPDAAAADLPQQPAIQSSPLGSTPLTHVTSASRSQQAPDVFQFPHPPPQRSPVKFSQATEMHPPSSQQFVRVSSASKLTDLPTRPVMERGNSAPTQFLHEQVRKLSEQQELQRKELEEQHYLAQKQYSEVMQQFLGQKPSEEQQQVLRSVLGDPSLLDVLRTLLLSTSAPTGTSNPGRLASNSSSTSPLPQQTSPPGQTFSLSPFTSPTQSTTDMKMVAAANTSDNSAGTAGLSLTPTLPGSSVLDTSSGSQIFPFTQQRKLKSIRSLSVDEKEMYQELRRQSHISAEQKRRGSIKQGFDHLQSLVINLSAYPSGKVSKATILEKSIEHINHVHQERESREREIAALKQEIKELNAAIARCQEQLPASGAPITRQRFEENRQRFKEYIQRRTLQNYKFWMFSIILQQLFESYNSMVSTGNSEELCRTVLAWFEQNCTLPSLRPVVMSSLRELSMKTSILTDPSQVPHQLAQFAKQDMQRKRSQNLPHLM